MPSLLYAESAWPIRFGRFVRALQMVAIAATVGAVGGGVAVLAVMGSGPPHKPAIVGAEGDNAAKALSAVGDAARPTPRSSAPAATRTGPAAGSRAPVTPPPAPDSPQPSQLAAAAAEPAAADAPQDTGPAAAPAASEVNTHAKPAEHSAHWRSAKLRARENHRQRNTAARYAREHNWHNNYDSYRPGERDAAERGIESGPFQRRVETGAIQRSYPYYDSAPRTGYWGGGSMFGNWGN